MSEQLVDGPSRRSRRRWRFGIIVGVLVGASIASWVMSPIRARWNLDEQHGLSVITDADDRDLAACIVDNLNADPGWDRPFEILEIGVGGVLIDLGGGHATVRNGESYTEIVASGHRIYSGAFSCP